MKPYILVIILFAFAITGCQQNDEPVLHQETGTVVDYGGAEYCSIVIELDNGEKIQPLYFPEGFDFVQGQRLLVSYMKLPNVISTCGKGTACEVVEVDELSCGYPLSEINEQDYNNLPNDPVLIQQVNISGDCLIVSLIYSGGCRNHTFSLIHTGNVADDEQTAVLELRHNANGDVCEAALSKELSYNLHSLKDYGYNAILFKALSGTGETYTERFELIP